jgi:hypothetical protein
MMYFDFVNTSELPSDVEKKYSDVFVVDGQFFKTSTYVKILTF